MTVQFSRVMSAATALIFVLSLSNLGMLASEQGATFGTDRFYQMPESAFLASPVPADKPTVQGYAVQSAIAQLTDTTNENSDSSTSQRSSDSSPTSTPPTSMTISWKVLEQGGDDSGTSYARLSVQTSKPSRVTLIYCTNNWNDGCALAQNRQEIASTAVQSKHTFSLKGLYYTYEPMPIYVQFSAIADDGATTLLPASGWETFETPSRPRGDLTVKSIKVQQVNAKESRYTVAVVVKNNASVPVGIQSSQLRLVIGTDKEAIESCAVGGCEAVGNAYNGVLTMSSPTVDVIGAKAEKGFVFGSKSETIQLQTGTTYTVKAIVDDNNAVQYPWNESDETNNTLLTSYATRESSIADTTKANKEPSNAKPLPLPKPISDDRDKLIVELKARIERLQLRIGELEQKVVARERERETNVDGQLVTRLQGKLLLQPHENGEVWYLDPATKKKFYLKDGEGAYQAMRAFGTGISEKDFANVARLCASVKGKILLRVEKKGEAYYMNDRCEPHYLKDGDAAYQIMKSQALGISNQDIAKIETGDLATDTTSQ